MVMIQINKCSKQLLYETNVGTKLIPNTRFKKQQQQKSKTE